MFRPTAIAAVLGLLACAPLPVFAQPAALPASTSSASNGPDSRAPGDGSANASADGNATATDSVNPSAPPRIPTQYSRLNTFRIPYGFDQQNVQGFEVLLYVSADRGANWTLYARQSPTEKMFAFRAGADGEYWFSSLTVPAGKQPRDLSTLNPQLRVVVDSKLPQMKLNATVTPNGQVQVAWEAFDANLDPRSLNVEVQWPGTSDWQPVAIDRADDGVQRTTVRGNTEVQPAAGADAVNVRVSARDRAQNVGVQARSLALSPPRMPIAGQPNRWSLTSVPPDPYHIHGTPPYSGFQPPRPPRAAGYPAASAPDASADNGAPATSDARSITWPSDNADAAEQISSGVNSSLNVGSNGPPANSSAGSSPPAAASAPAATAAVGDTAVRTTIRDDQWQPSTREHNRQFKQPAVSETASSSAQPLRDPTAEELANRPLLPNGERPQMTRSTRFNLSYSIDAVGPAGVEKVELWITRNGGRNWKLWGTDEDCESPLLVEVADDGIYGFRVVIIGKNGLASATPRDGDLADLWVGVDTNKPHAEITRAAYGTGVHAGQLDIRWQAADDHLATRPITLQFSDTPDGNWTTIASGLPNTGQYYWRVDARVPSQFYLRLEVRDEAGNVAVHHLNEPIASAGLIPRGTIRSVSPLLQ